MTTETDSSKQSEPRPLSEAELEAVTGGDVAAHMAVYAYSVHQQRLDCMLPGCRE
jgi:hypothetical protein